jgi:predicted O-methyltransferase YrrM
VGRLLHVLARSIGARRVLELGSGFGYSAYWFAQAVGARGEVVLTESSAENAEEAAAFLARGGLAARTRILVGNALELADGLEGPFDIVFNDIDKEDYPLVPAKLPRLLRPGGLFISDNMLWFGTVLDVDPVESSTLGVRALTRMLHESPEFETTLLPLRDGVTVSVYDPRPDGRLAAG